MERPRRTHAEARAQMRAGILRLGRAQLAEVGAAGLSVREIARGLGVASSAIYRHVANRDALLTLLVVDAYTELAEAVAARVSANEAPARRLRQLACGMREWAVAHPESWALLYGSPVPGYQAPAAQTTPVGTRVMVQFLGVLAAGNAAVRHSERPPVSAGLAAELSGGIEELSRDADQDLAAEAASAPPFAADALESWTALIGIISAEIFGQLGSDLAAYGEELLQRWTMTTAHRFGLR
ncbi:TetR/AcrR family transcriptional regulator [Leucobacter sp. NPDC077196]|uniref:TetR/AcrR family transcriptional regulator n=1 Tax=Leucobacter sp. NPDC077196 TaxID=3154959 RepID=UPI003440A865